MKQVDTGSTSPTKMASTWLAVASLALSMLLSSLGVSIANVALPTIATAFSATFQGTQWVILSYLITIAVVIVSAGRLGDLLGRRRVLLIGISVFTVGSALCGIAPSLTFLVIARIVQGLGASVLMALTIAMVRQSIPSDRVGTAMGLLGTTSAIGTAMGPSLGGFLLVGPGWRAVFFVLIPLGVLNFLMAQKVLPKATPKKKLAKSDFDLLGTLLLCIALAAYSLAMAMPGENTQLLRVGFILVCIVGAYFFVRVENRAKAPLAKISKITSSATLVGGLVTNVIVASIMMSTLVVGPFFLSQSLELSPIQVGLVMAAGPTLSIFSGIPSGRLVDMVGPRRVLLGGLVAMIAGAFMLSYLPVHFGIAGYIIAIVILTPGYQLFQAANNTVVTQSADKNEHGVISGLLGLSRNLGLITGASVMGAVFAWATQSDAITLASPKAVANGMQVTFLLATVLLWVALGFATRMGLENDTKTMVTGG